MEAWMWWFIAALGLAGLEIVTVDLFFIMAAGGAVAAGIGALFGVSVVGQFVIFGVVSLVLIGGVRRVALRHYRVPPTRTNVDLLVGSEGYVLEQVDARDGRVKVRGEVWSARSTDEGAVHEPGAKVHVTSVSGATVMVTSDADATQA